MTFSWRLLIESCFHSVVGLLVWPCERLLGGEREEKHPLPLLWGHERGNQNQCTFQEHGDPVLPKHVVHTPAIVFPPPRILGVKWSASWGTWTCRSLMRSSARLWSSRPSRTWRRTRWPTTPASQHRCLIIPSLRSWEKVHHSALGLVQENDIDPKYPKCNKNLPHVEFKLKTVNGQHITWVTNCC